MIVTFKKKSEIYVSHDTEGSKPVKIAHFSIVAQKASLCESARFDISCIQQHTSKVGEISN